MTAPYDLVIESISVPDTGLKCTSSNYIEVSDLTTLQTTISISENEIGELKKGLEAEITLPADETKTYTGRITLIGLIFSILNKSDSVFLIDEYWKFYCRNQ